MAAEHSSSEGVHQFRLNCIEKTCLNCRLVQLINEGLSLTKLPERFIRLSRLARLSKMAGLAAS